MPKHSKDKEVVGGSLQTAVRLENETVARIDALAVKLSRPGLTLTRADVFRMALAEGLPILEKER
jgi:predicted DNA-binding protein